jgi:hypothetical protein
MPIVFPRLLRTNFRYVLSLSFALLVVLSAHDARAQAVYGSISGIVTDASGAIVPGATVTITSVERQTSDTVVSSDSGYYLKDRLLPGLYQVKAELQGFKTAVFDNIRISVDTQTPLNVKLETGAVTESVKVEASTPVLKTDRADVASTFESRQITDMPILDRNFTKLVLLTPGTQMLGWQHAASENPQGSTQTMVNGQHFSGTGYQLDGTDNRDPVLGIIVINPNFEAIGETKITSQNYDAEFGQATAGVVSVQTKSGTNALRGSGFEFFQNDAFQSRNPFTQALPDSQTGKFIPDTNKNQYGGSIGGPIQKDRFFFFGDYQGTRSKVGGSKLLSVPTAAARNGDLSAYGVNIFDPLSGATPATRSQFGGNVIPAGRISQQARNILNLIPLPNRPGTVNGTRDNFVASGSEIFDNDTFDTRVDGRINPRLNLFARYSYANFTRDGPTAFGSGGGQELVTLGGDSKVRNQSFAAGADRTIGSNMMADFRVGYFKYKVAVLPFDFGTTPASDAGIPGLNNDTNFTSGLFGGFVRGNEPDLNFGSGLGVNRCNCPLDEDESQLQMVGNLTKLMSTHTFKFGVDIRHAWNLRVPSDQHRSGELTFNADRTRGPDGGGLGLATLLLGDVSSFQRYTSPFTDAGERQWRSFYYAQDTWRASQKLTVNYGLRLDIINPQTVSDDGKGGFLLANVTGDHEFTIPSPNIRVGGVGGVPLNGGVKNALNWAPRVGLAYQLNERTVIRGGYGRSYDIGVFGSLFGHTVTQNLPVLSAQSLSGPNSFDAVFNLAQGPPAASFPAPDSSGQIRLPSGVFARVLPDKQRLPAVDAYNVTVQRELGPMMSLEVAYVGNHAARVFAEDNPDENLNEPTLVGFPGVPRDQRRPFFAQYGWTQDFAFYCNCATNRYDSLQTKFTKRFSAGWSVFSQYTMQRERQHGDSQFFIVPDLSYGPAGWDRVHSFSIATSYELPWMRTNPFLGGWQFNQNTIIQSGLPYDVTYRDAGSDRDVGPNRPDLIGDPSGPGTRDQWFNAAPIGAAGSAFGRPAVATFGNLPRNDLWGPAYWRVDASMFKRIHFGDTQALELRVEAVNIFNHVNLGNPDGEIGVPGNNNPNAGRITSTAFGNTDPQRNFQFAVKFIF